MVYLESFDTRQLRDVLGTFTTGVTIVTTRDASGMDYGVTANSFSSVSLDPPLVLWSQALTSKSFPAFRDSDHFVVNILADDQIAVSNYFAKSKENKFAEMEFTRGLGDAPVLPGTAAHFECIKVAAYPAGDHMIFLGRVERVSHSDRRPLAFAHGRYMIPYAHDLGPVSLRETKAPIPTCDAVALVMNSLLKVSEATGGLSVSFAVWGNHGPTVICRHQGVAASDDWLCTGLVMSTTQTAAGRAFAAFLPQELTKAFVEEDLRQFRVADEDETEQRRSFDELIAIAREHGFVHAVDVRPDPQNGLVRNTFTVPVYDVRKQMIFALSVAADAASLPADFRAAVPRALLGSADSLTKEIAAQPPAEVARLS